MYIFDSIKLWAQNECFNETLYFTYLHLIFLLSHINSRPSYLRLSTKVSCNKTVPSVRKADMYVAVFPSNSVVFNATMAVSFDPGINLKEEKPCFGCSFVICNER